MSASSGGEDYEGRIARGAGISSFGQAIGRMTGYALQVVLARMYGPAALGLYILGVTAVSIANILAQFGMDSGVVRYVAHHRARGDDARVRGTILLALAASFALSLALAAFIFFGAGMLADGLFGKPRLEGILRVFAVSVPFMAVMGVALWATQGFQTVKYATYVQQVIHPLANLALVVAFYLIAAEIVGAVIAYVLSTVFATILSLYYLARIFPKILDKSTPPKFEGRALLGASAPMLVVNFADNMNVWAAVTILGVFASAGEVGIYNAAARTAALSMLVLVAFRGIFSPMISELHGRGRGEELGLLYKEVTRWIFTGSLVIFLLTAILARDVMSVFGEDFVSGWPALVVIAAAQLFNSSGGLTNSALAMTGHQRAVMTATLVSAIVLVVGSVVLVPAYGLMGAAVATAASIALSNAMTIVAVRNRLGFWPYSVGYVKPIAAGLVATVATLAARFFLSPPDGIPAILVLASIFAISFAAALVALGLGPGDRRFIASLWQAARGVLRL